MEKDSFSYQWLRYFLTRDIVGKLLLLLTVILATVWALFVRESIPFALVVVGALVVTVLFSLLNYATVGRMREKAEYKFYDAIHSACDLPYSFKGRNMKGIKVHWKGLKVARVALTVSSNSSAAKSAKEWRSIKLSVEDSFKLTGSSVVALLENHNAGRLEFVAGNDAQFAAGGEYSRAWFEEGLRAFTYEILAEYGTPLPRLRINLHEDGRSQPHLESVEIQLTNTTSNYDKKNFEASFRNRYEQPDTLWGFKWDSTGVTIESISKGSEQDKKIQTAKSIEDLIALSARTAFHKYSSDGDYIFTHDMIGWSHGGGNDVETISINFLQGDLSQPDQLRRFESLMSQGLTQLFHTTFEYSWDITPYEKKVFIRKEQR